MSFIKQKQLENIVYPLVWEFNGTELVNGTTYHGVGDDTNISGWHIKPNIPMYFGPNGKFVKVYKDGTELIYGTDWNEGKAIFMVGDLIPSIRLHINQYDSNSVYRVEYYEQQSFFDPFLTLYRSDDKRMNPTMPTPRIHYDNGTDQWYGVITQVVQIGNFEYNLTYESTDKAYSAIIRKCYGETLAIQQFKKEESFPNNIRMEIYTRGKIHGGPTTKNGNVNYNPIYATTNNNWTFVGWVTGHPRKRIYVKVRLRDTERNIVSQFSSRTLHSKRVFMWQEGYYGDSPIGEMFISKLI